MRFTKLKFQGFYSYGDETEISLEENIAVIVGPNNAGKSNIFRIMNLISDMFSKDQMPYLDSSDYFSESIEPKIEVKCDLSVNEIDWIIDYLSFYEFINAGNSATWKFHKFQNREHLREYLKQISIRMVWKQRYPQYGKEPVDIEIEFNKIGLTFYSPDYHSECFIRTAENRKNSQMELRKFLDSITMDANVPETALKIFAPGDQLSKLTGYLPFYNQNHFEEEGNIALRNVITFARSADSRFENGLRFFNLIGILLKKSLKHASGRRTYHAGKLEFTDELLSDGSNLSQFLYSLKNSPSLKDRNRYYAIKEAFEDVLKAEELTFDAIIEFKEDETSKKENIFGDESKPIRKPNTSRIMLIDKKVRKDFRLDQAGSGIGEILYLLTLTYGVQNGIILLDEPAINLHPPQMKALIQKIVADLYEEDLGYWQLNTKNQYIIVTHSAELASLLLFEEKVSFIHVQRKGKLSSSKVSSLDGESKSWFSNSRDSLRHGIDARMFFGKKLIFTEGGSDTNFLLESARYFATIDQKLDLSTNNILVVNVDGKYNFVKYKRLSDSLSIPYVMLGDKDVLDMQNTRDLFTPHNLITKSGIIHDDKAAGSYVIEEGKLEDLMNEIHSHLYNSVVKEIEVRHGRNTPKSEVASEFVKRLTSSDPKLLDSIRIFIQEIVAI